MLCDLRGREDDSVDLAKSFSDDSFRRALEDWAWLPGSGKRPFLASLFGDVFLEAAGGCLDSAPNTQIRTVTGDGVVAKIAAHSGGSVRAERYGGATGVTSGQLVAGSRVRL